MSCFRVCHSDSATQVIIEDEPFADKTDSVLEYPLPPTQSQQDGNAQDEK